MLGLKYLSPDGLRQNKELVQGYYDEERGSPVIKSGKALSVVLREVPFRTSKILECGPGGGELLASLEAQGYRSLAAADIDDYTGQDRFTVEKVDFSFDRLPWTDSFFDAICTFETIEHIENPYHFIREMRRVLKPGGVLILSMPNVQHIFNKIFFLRKGDMPRWRKNNGHLWVPPRGVFAKAFMQHFTLERTEYHWGFMPYRQLSKLNIWPETELFAHTAIFIFKAI